MTQKRMMSMLLAFGLTTGIATFLFQQYAVAVGKGLRDYAVANFDMVEPNFVAEDSTAAQPGAQDDSRKTPQTVPDFVLKDRFGNDVSFSQFDSVDVVLINLWNSGCPVCEEEIPSLSEMDRRLDSVGNVVLLTITTDEKWAEVQRFFPVGTDLRVLFDPEEKVTQEIFGTEKFPETFVLDKQRRIRARFDGQRLWHSPEMLDYIGTFL